MLIAVEHISPAPAPILRQKNASTGSVYSCRPGPRCKVKTVGIGGIDGQSIGSIHILRQLHRCPGLCSVGRFIEGAIAARSDAAIFAASSNRDIQGTVVGASQPPCQRLILCNPLVLQDPGSAIV